MPTLTSTRILKKTLEAYRTLFPFINKFNTDFTTEQLVLGQVAIAHIRSLPTLATYDAVTGYANGAVSARTLLTDLPLTVDSHKHVPIYLDHIDAISDEKDAFTGSLEDQAYVLGKGMIDSILAKAVAANLSYSQTAATADSDLDVIEAITSLMNTNKAAPRGRIGLVSTAVAQALALDSRIASKDYYGQLTGAGGLRVFKGVGGFEAIYEYPGLPANGENLTGLFFTSEAIALYTGVPKRSHEIAAAMGIPQTVKMDMMTDPINGFALAHLCWMQPGTVDLYSTVSSLWGSAVGSQGGAAGALTDRSAVRLVSV